MPKTGLSGKGRERTGKGAKTAVMRAFWVDVCKAQIKSCKYHANENLTIFAKNEELRKYSGKFKSNV